MSRGLGRVERAILALIEDEGGVTEAEGLANDIYRPAAMYDGWRCTRAQRVAVLRAMHSLARKYPDTVALAGGKGREPLWIGSPRSNEERPPVSERKFDPGALIG